MNYSYGTIRIVFFTLLAFLSASDLNAQENENFSPIHETIIPPSPQASDLGKFVDTEVNYHTGTPNIGVPVYTIQGKDISHNVSIQYDASGRKPEEIASNVGLGWTLNAGGVITRTVRGMPDETSLKGYFEAYNTWLNEHQDRVQSASYDPSDATDPTSIFLLSAFGGNQDLLPDVYHFNFNGHSGKIMFDAVTKEPFVIPHQNIKIERTFYNNGTSNSYDFNDDSWTITTPDGTRYQFNRSDAETTDSNGTTGVFISAWHLSFIENANLTEKIAFEYNTDINNESIRRYSVSSARFQKAGSPPVDACNYPEFPATFDDEADVFSTKYLTSISYIDNVQNTATLQMSLWSKNDRLDALTSYTPILHRLDSINVEDLTTNNSLKTFLFHQSYFGGPQKRMRLDSLEEKGKPAYLFQYNEDIEMPDYQSMSKDHWGYYNGINNSSLIPVAPKEYLTGGVYLNHGLATADRDSRADASLTYLLKKITYPTAGYSEYIYEPHIRHEIDTNCVEYTSTAATAYSDENDHGTMDALSQEVYDLYYDYVQAQQPQLTGGYPNVSASPFTITDAQYVQLTYNENIVGASNHAEPTQVALFPYPLPSSWEQEIQLSGAQEISLTAGDYVLVAMTARDLQDGNSKGVSLEYFIKHPQCEVNEIIGGARVKKITVNDDSPYGEDMVYEFKYVRNFIDEYNALFTGPSGPDTPPNLLDAFDFPSVASYDYASNGNAIESSLTVHHRPVYFEVKACNDLVASAYDNNPFSRINGNHIGYDEVTMIKSGIENGVTVFKYLNNPNPSFRSNMTATELYKYEEAFDQNNDPINPLTIVQKTENEYDEHMYGHSVEGLKVEVTSVEFNTCVNGDCDFYNIYEVGSSNKNRYEYGTSFLPLSRTITTTYDGTDAQQIITEYSYDITEINGIKFDRPTTEIVHDITSNYSKYKRFYYTHSYDNSTHPVIDDLKAKHICDFVIDEEIGIVVNGDFQTTLEQVIYPELDNGRIVQDKVYQYTISAPIDALDIYTPKSLLLDNLKSNILLADFDYDAHTNLVQKTGRDEVPKSYIWSYNGTFPIAEVINANKDEIAYTSFETEHSNSNWTHNSSNVSQGESYSGDKYYLLDNSNNISKTNLPTGQYLISFRTLPGTLPQLLLNGNQQTISTEAEANNWFYHQGVVDITSSTDALLISGTGPIDEVRLYPVDAQMTTLTYQPYVGITSIVDPNGIITHFSYDPLERLSITKDHENNVLQQYIYHYKRDNIGN